MNEDEEFLRNCATAGDIEGLRKIIEKGIDINAADSEGFTALHNAMMWLPHLKDKNFLAITELLVENGADVNAVTEYGETPLYLAAIEGFFDVVVYLHQKGAGITNLVKKNGFTPIHEICKKIPGIPKNFALIIDEKKITDPDEIRKIHGSHPDDEYFGYINTARYLIENGINVNQKTDKGQQTPLFHASDEGDQEIVEMLLENGADVNLQDDWGVTPLHYASRKGHLGNVKLLVKAGADVNAKKIMALHHYMRLLKMTI